MNQDAFYAEFGAMTEDEQATMIGGTEIASAIGWAMGYATSCLVQAIVVANKIQTQQPLLWVDGYGFI
jgi:hypothetical protein